MTQVCSERGFWVDGWSATTVDGGSGDEKQSGIATSSDTKIDHASKKRKS